MTEVHGRDIVPHLSDVATSISSSFPFPIVPIQRAAASAGWRAVLPMFRFSIPIPLPLCLSLLAVGASPLEANDVIPFAAAGGEARPPRVLVLPDGRTIQGDIRVTHNGYEVSLSRNSGRSYIAPGMVWFTADNMEHAYEQYRERHSDRTADGYVLLANWCIQNGLYDHARDELKAALRMDPKHATAQLTAKELGKLLSNRQTPLDARANDETTTSVASPPVQEADLLKSYVRHVQPILMNGCGNAECHGLASTHDFRLMNVRSGHPAFEKYTQLNYDTISRLINAKNPEGSQLLTAPQDTAHANRPSTPFRGKEGQRQLQILSAWVKLAARYQTEQQGSTSNSPRSPISQIAEEARSPKQGPGQISSSEPTDRSVVHAINFEPIESQNANSPIANSNVSTANTGNHPRNASPSSPESGSARRLDDILNQAIQSGVPDAFDPQDFNRQFSSQSNLSTPSNSNGPKR